MLKKIWVLVALVASSFSVLMAQNSTNFNFPVDKFDFGVVDEPNKAAHTFEFTNVGKDTILLKSENVRASCGCTTPSFSTEAILPGQKGTVTAEFNSQGRPGAFHKTVTIYYKDQVAKVLTIKGIVEPVVAGVVVTDAQLKKSPKIVLEKTTINFGKVEKGQKGLYSVKVTNAGKDTLFITKTQAACSCINYKLLKEKTTEEVKYILLAKSASLQLTYYPSSDGFNRDVLVLYTNDLTNKRVPLYLESQVVETLKQNSIIQEDKGVAPFAK
ncbi:MAG: DUF1573 domain-containing protein [Cytophagales bacterium]|nr:DUF1573 domain-containing protein [Cytophaga sp.]